MLKLRQLITERGITMPYIAVKMWPKDDAQKKALAENLAKAVVDTLGCPPQAVTLSIEEIEQEKWVETVGPELEAKQDKMYIVKGEKAK